MWRCVQKTDRNPAIFLANWGFPIKLRKPPGNRNNLTDDFRVPVKSVFFIATETPRVRMDNECAIFDIATRGKMNPIALENNIDRLLPKRLRHKVKGGLSAAVDHDYQSLC